MGEGANPPFEMSRVRFDLDMTEVIESDFSIPSMDAVMSIWWTSEEMKSFRRDIKLEALSGQRLGDKMGLPKVLDASNDTRGLEPYFNKNLKKFRSMIRKSIVKSQDELRLSEKCAIEQEEVLASFAQRKTKRFVDKARVYAKQDAEIASLIHRQGETIQKVARRSCPAA